MIDGKHIAQRIFNARTSDLAMAFSRDEIAALSSYITMLEQVRDQYNKLHSQMRATPSLDIEEHLRDIESTLDSIRQRIGGA